MAGKDLTQIGWKTEMKMTNALAHATETENRPPVTLFETPWLLSLVRTDGLGMNLGAKQRIDDLISTWKPLIKPESPADHSEIYKEIAMLLGTFPTFGAGDQSTKDLLRIYAIALEDFPIWAIRRVVRRVIKGEIEVDKRVAPTPPIMCDLVRSQLAHHVRELEKLESLSASGRNITA
jgi:hypothetical protein